MDYCGTGVESSDASPHIQGFRAFLVASFGLPALSAAQARKPTVRAITGFITIDAKSYKSQIDDAVQFLTKCAKR